MMLELKFVHGNDDAFGQATAYVVLNHYTTIDFGLPRLTASCVSMGELERELLLLEQQIAAIRSDGRTKFLAWNARGKAN